MTELLRYNWDVLSGFHIGSVWSTYSKTVYTGFFQVGRNLTAEIYFSGLNLWENDVAAFVYINSYIDQNNPTVENTLSSQPAIKYIAQCKQVTFNCEVYGVLSVNPTIAIWIWN